MPKRNVILQDNLDDHNGDNLQSDLSNSNTDASEETYQYESRHHPHDVIDDGDGSINNTTISNNVVDVIEKTQPALVSAISNQFSKPAAAAATGLLSALKFYLNGNDNNNNK